MKRYETFEMDTVFEEDNEEEKKNDTEIISGE